MHHRGEELDVHSEIGMNARVPQALAHLSKEDLHFRVAPLNQMNDTVSKMVTSIWTGAAQCTMEDGIDSRQW